VLTGVVILSGLYALGRKWNRQTGFFAALCYALMPWTFFHERLAVADSLVAACAVMMLVAAFQHIKRPSRLTILFLTVSMIALPLSKLSAATLLAIPLIIALNLTGLRDLSGLRKLWLPYLISGVVLAILLGYTNSRYNVGQEVIQRAGFGQRTLLAWWSGNTSDVILWSVPYLGIIGVLIIGGALIALWRRSRLDWIAVMGFVIALGTYLVAPSTAYPRYYLPALAFGSLLAGVGVSLLWQITLPKVLKPSGGWLRAVRWAITILIFGIFFLPFISFTTKSFSNPLELPLVYVDRQQHITLWSSGYGIREAMQFVSEQAKKESEPSIVYVSDLAGMVTARLYWTGNGRVLTLWDATMGASVEDVDSRVASGKPTFLLLDTDHFKANFVGLEVNPHELARFPRPEGGKPVIVYRLKREAFQFPKE
jgi:4-amino-4-deoxy-L-arabinose transferase-like glycosyltransferase